MDVPSKATTTVSIILTLVLFQDLVQMESSRIGLQNHLDIYQNITTICPQEELCKNRSGRELLSRLKGCQCDEMCSVYEDCCRDSQFFIPSDVPKTNFSCVVIPIAFIRNNPPIRMITSCPPDASPEEHQLCGTSNELEHFLSMVPITVTEDHITVIYRNVYCARCNNVMNASYQLWNTTLVCDGGTRGTKSFPEDAEAAWDPGKNRWIYVEGNKTLECDMKMIKPDHLNSILPHVNCPTVPYEDQCPDESDQFMSQLCRGYTAVVRWRRRNRMFKNQHCLICHGGTQKDIRCGTIPDVTPRSGISRVTADINKYAVLLRYARSECRPGEQYDGILKECVQLFPPRVTHYGKNVTSIETCVRATISARLYELSSNNSTVTIPKYDRNFTQGQFRLKENGELEICEKDVPPVPPTVLSFTIAVLTISGFGLSIIFLLLHLCAVILVAELRNFSGIALASLCFALLGGYFSFIAGVILRDGPYLWCYTCAIISYYFFMSSFFWMLVLAFDVSKVLRASVRKLRAARGFRRRQFITYSIISWGIPILFCVAAHLIEHACNSADNWFRPMFGLNGCWFGNPHSHLIFFVIPLAVIMLLNFSFFLYAAWVTSDNPTGQRKNLRVYAKLTILLGLNWIVGLLARMFDSDALWVIFSIINTFQGLFIFMSFTWTSKVSKGLSRIFPWFGKSRDETFPQTSTSKETTFSSQVPVTVQDVVEK